MVSVLALAWCLAGVSMSFAVRQAHAQVQEVAAPAATMVFDISAQRLGDAIDAYNRLTGMDVLVDGVHAQRLSGTVQGTMTAQEALNAMLSGTGLEARQVSANALVIRAAPLAGTAAAPGMETSGFNEGEVLHQSYAAQVQQALRDNLCNSAQTRPGRYRLALQLHLDARGTVDRFRLLSTTGEPARDAAVQARVRQLSVGSAPPASLPQPLVILLLPEGPGAHADCMGAAGGIEMRAP